MPHFSQESSYESFFYEEARLASLHAHGVLDTEPEALFDDLAQLAADLCNVPMAAVSLVDAHRQWFKASVGLDCAETPREHAFCDYTIRQDDLLVVADAQADPRFCANPLVTGEPHIRFYAGMPLKDDDGFALGSLCIIDRAPRILTADQERLLRRLARQAAGHLRAARQAAAQRAAQRALEEQRAFIDAVLENMQEGIVACDAEGRLTLFNRATREFHGLPASPLPPEAWAEHFDLYQSDGLTPMATEDIPLYRAFRGETVRDAAMVIAPKNGAARSVMAGGSPLFGANGEQIGAVAVMHDVTARLAVERERARLAAIVESSEDGVIAATLDGIVVSWNQGAERLYGYSAGEIMGRPASLLSSAAEKRLVAEVTARLQRGETAEPIETSRIRRDGTRWAASLSFSPIRSEDGHMIGLSCITRDITEQQQVKAALAESEARLRRLSDAAFEGICISRNGVLLDVNAAYVEMFGFDRPEELVGSDGFQRLAPEARAVVRQRVTEESEAPYEVMMLRRDGTTFPAEVRARYLSMNGQPARVAVVRDMTRQKALEEEQRHAAERIADYNTVLEFQMLEMEKTNAELERVNAELAALAATDGLTGLLNHRTFQARLNEEVVRAARYGLPLALALLDVDHFKRYNDTFGHPAGDAVLRAVGAALRAEIRETDFAARYGGEEFALLLPQTSGEGAEELAERLRAALAAHPWPQEAVTASFGVAVLRPGEDGGAGLLERADAALYRAKSAGRNRVCVAETALPEPVSEKVI